MYADVIGFMQNVLGSWTQTGLYYAFSALLFVVLCRGNTCNANLHYWKRANVIVDLCYWFVVPIVSKFVKIFFLVIGAHYVLGLHTDEAQSAYFAHGYGFFGALPMWSQVLLILIFSDIMLYWIHRGFHTNGLWKIHAIHHSSKDLDWASAARFHPLNTWGAFLFVDVCMLMLGFAPEAFIILGPFNVIYSTFVHANLNWTFGKFNYVMASPVFHRWHHTSPAEGGSKNFAPTFPILDVLFGTYYMPKGKLPEVYGVDDKAFPHYSFFAQLVYPFRK
jgi:sterol desaturase/sphingolipid hydroxylase (fatty acid hydroxylase superfamily)